MIRWPALSKFKISLMIALPVVVFSIFAHKLSLPSPQKAVQKLPVRAEPPDQAYTRPVDVLPLEESQKKTPRQIASEEKSVTEPVQALASAQLPIQQIPETKSLPTLQPPVEETPTAQISTAKTDFWIWIGMGASFTSYKQSVPGLSTLSFGRISSPSQTFKAGFFFDDQYGLDLGYEMTPGKIESASEISVSIGDYQWKKLSAELIYRANESRLINHTEWIWRLGIQQHEIPFIVPLTANSITMSSNEMTALSAGIEHRTLTNKNIRIETLFRYQHPMASSSAVASNFKILPQYALDASVGAVREFRPNLSVGVYWHGQYHRYNFDYTNEPSFISGDQTLFRSNFDLRLGVEF